MKGRGMVAAQHERYFRKKGNFNKPQEIFSSQLIPQLRAWHAVGEEVILFIDVNKNVYTGPLAKALQGNGLWMEEQTLRLTGKEAPHSHCTGKVAIVGMYATPGIICTNSYLSPHGAGAGNHWFQLRDFDAHTVLGTDYPKTAHSQGRALRCGVERTVKWYNKVLRQLLICHRSFEKFDFLQSNHHLMSADDFQILFNRWDMEVTQLMLALEKRCNKFCDGSIEFSPVTGIWIRCLQAYHWVQQFHKNKVAHGGNLFQTCRHLNIASPLVLTPAQVILNVNEFMTWLEGLKKDAPKLQNAHLPEFLSSACVREDTALVIAIQKILCAESIRHRWCLVLGMKFSKSNKRWCSHTAHSASSSR
jgi:hypothetical protein